MNLEKNARVDQVGRNHEGKIIYKVTVDGYEKELYLVDANTSTLNWQQGKSGNNHPDNMPPTPEPVMLSTFDPFSPSASWMDWYKAQTGRTGPEAFAEGKRRISLLSKQ
jgi:hypothetical protein